VFDRLASGQIVEGGVAQGSSSGSEIAQDRGALVLGEPAQHSAGPLVAGQVVVQGVQVGADLAVVVAEQLAKPPLKRAVCASASEICDHKIRIS
jgi:hypothetical protein